MDAGENGSDSRLLRSTKHLNGGRKCAARRRFLGRLCEVILVGEFTEETAGKLRGMRPAAHCQAGPLQDSHSQTSRPFTVAGTTMGNGSS